MSNVRFDQTPGSRLGGTARIAWWRRWPLGLGLLLLLPSAAWAASAVFPGASWVFKTPAEAGLDSTRLNQFATNVGGDGVIIKDGYLVKAWGDYSTSADWASAVKPVVTTMLLFAVHEGKLSGVDAPVRDFWKDGDGNDLLIPKDRTMTFRHLANMTSGYARGEDPGQAWAYNDYAIKLYDVTLFDKVFNEGTPNDVATTPARLGALQFEDGSIFSSRGGYGLSTSPRDFARIGWFWLNKGNWNGQQLLPESYFDAYMIPDVPGDLPRTQIAGTDYLGLGSDGGGSDQTSYGPGIYGSNAWFNARVGTSEDLTWPYAPVDLFQANGHWNVEVMSVVPSLGLVVAARGSWGDFVPGSASAGMNQNLGLLWDSVVTGVEAETNAPRNRLLPSRPNPFSPVTEVPYEVATPGRVVVRIFDASGRLLRTLEDVHRSPGRYSARWDGRADHGGEPPSGIYFCLIAYPDGTRSEQKLTLVR